MKTNIVFFGAGAYVIPIMEYVYLRQHLSLVVTTENSTGESVSRYAQQQNIPLLQVKSLKDPRIIQEIKSKETPIAVLAHFGLIVPQAIIDIFPKGIINLHPSLLPKYRGATPGQTAIVNGDTTTGITLILLDKDMDHGPILIQEADDILPYDTAVSFYERIFVKGTRLLEEVFVEYLDGKLTPIPQDDTKATYIKLLTREDGFVDSEKKIEKDLLYRMIRAYYPWPGTWTVCHVSKSKLDKKIIKFLPPTPTEKHEEDFLIQVEGKKPVSVKDFLNGYPEAKEWIKKFIR